jgi:hypothetical protein
MKARIGPSEKGDLRATQSLERSLPSPPSPLHLDCNNTRHHDARVRTTVTLEADVAVRLKEFAHRRRLSFKAALNDALRRGLSGQSGARKPQRFVVEPHSGGFRQGIDPGKLNQLVDDLALDDFGPNRSR